MAPGERRIDSPVSGPVVNNFIKGKIFDFPILCLKHVSDNFPTFVYSRQHRPPSAGGVLLLQRYTFCGLANFPHFVYSRQHRPPEALMQGPMAAGKL